MRRLWERLEAVAATTPLPPRLRPPATEAAIRAAERTLGMTIPDDFRASLLVHDGQEPPGDDEEEDDVFAWLPGHARLAPLDAIVDGWTRECETFATQHAGEAPTEIEDGRLYHYLWHPRRIPIAGNRWWDQDNTLLDLFPGPRGTSGQLVMFGKGVFGAYHGPSFRAPLEIYVRALETGAWGYRDGAIVARSKRETSWLRYVRRQLTR